MGDHFDIVEIGEHKLFAAFHLVEAEAMPEIDQPRLRMGIDASVSLFLTEFETRPHQLERIGEVTVVIHRFDRSGCASGPAIIAAVIADRLSVYAPNGPPTMVPAPDAARIARAGTFSYPKVRSTAKPGTFCPAIVTT